MADLRDFPSYRNFLRARREERGLTTRALAQLSGLKVPTLVSLFENGHRTPTAAQLRQLAAPLEISTEDLAVLLLEIRGAPSTAARVRLGPVGVAAVGWLPPGLCASTAVLDRYRATHAAVAASLDAMRTPSPPDAWLTQLVQATSARGLALLEGELRDLASGLAGLSGDGPASHLTLVEVFPLTRPVSAVFSRLKAGISVPSLGDQPTVAAYVETWLRATGASPEWLAENVGRHPSVVRRALASGRLSLVLGSQIATLLLKLGELDTDDHAQFERMLRAEHRSGPTRAALEATIARHRSERARRADRPPPEAEVLADIRCLALLDLPHCVEVRDSGAGLGRLLLPPTSDEEAHSAIRRLIQSRFLRPVAPGSDRLRSDPAPIWLRRRLAAGVLQPELFAFARAMHLEACRRLPEHPNEPVADDCQFWIIPSRPPEGARAHKRWFDQRLGRIGDLLGGFVAEADRVIAVNLHTVPITGPIGLSR